MAKTLTKKFTVQILEETGHEQLLSKRNKKRGRKLIWTPEYCIKMVQFINLINLIIVMLQLKNFKWVYYWGIPLNARAVYENLNMLWKKAYEFFRGYKNLISAAAIDYSLIRRNRKQSKELVISDLQKIKAVGHRLNSRNLQEKFSYVVSAAYTKFDGGLAEAEEKAGFNYKEESKFITSKRRLKQLTSQKLASIKKNFSSSKGVNDE